MRGSLLEEISQVVLALPELKGVPGVEERFSVERLESNVNMIIEKTAQPTCSMVWDLRAGRETEIKFINDPWSRMGRKYGGQNAHQR
ncbi:2-dehydropantoate 2-reductase family protein [Penicillium hetheringtonii]|uniref:2-dehydropantoate 2-reductase family protein n=1 Tax=Penicillium hetheringtonii TaxID=911720 RepID=A0AAD6E247_9EURO|nr:2-dehydropantoate 2-reductase family protein [Penicillium hetheringtonii]